MKATRSIISIILLLCVLVSGLASCAPQEQEPEHVDYAASVELDMNSAETVKITASVQMYIDGDTTHFALPSGGITHEAVINNILKARYLAINTPESTGKIEPWGNDAAAFTKSTLQKATEIVLESDNNTWNVDSTGNRITVWVWYKTAESDKFRNLNIEILQNGLAIGSKAGNNRYGETCMKAIAQAKSEKLYVHNPDKIDPDFPYGDPTDILLRDVRLNIEDHYYMNVYFEGVVVQDAGGTIYVESYDEQTGLYYGITAYYGTSGLPAQGLEKIRVGNKVRLVGVVTYFEGGDIWQLSDLYYDPWEPDDPRCLEFVSEGHEPAYTLTTAATFLGNKEITIDGVTSTHKYADLVMNTSIAMENLVVERAYTTSNGGSSDGAMTLTCRSADGKTIKVRTAPNLKKDDGSILTESDLVGKTISVRGMVDEYHDEYQIQVFGYQHIVFGATLN